MLVYHYFHMDLKPSRQYTSALSFDLPTNYSTSDKITLTFTRQINNLTTIVDLKVHDLIPDECNALCPQHTSSGNGSEGGSCDMVW